MHVWYSAMCVATNTNPLCCWVWCCIEAALICMLADVYLILILSSYITSYLMSFLGPNKSNTSFLCICMFALPEGLSMSHMNAARSSIGLVWYYLLFNGLRMPPLCSAGCSCFCICLLTRLKLFPERICCHCWFSSSPLPVCSGCQSTAEKSITRRNSASSSSLWNARGLSPKHLCHTAGVCLLLPCALWRTNAAQTVQNSL